MKNISGKLVTVEADSAADLNEFLIIHYGEEGGRKRKKKKEGSISGTERHSPGGKSKMLKGFAIALEKIIRQLGLLHLTKHQAQMNCIPEF